MSFVAIVVCVRVNILLKDLVFFFGGGDSSFPIVSSLFLSIQGMSKKTSANWLGPN